MNEETTPKGAWPMRFVAPIAVLASLGVHLGFHAMRDVPVLGVSGSLLTLASLGAFVASYGLGWLAHRAHRRPTR